MGTKLKINITKEILERSKMCGVGTDENVLPTNCAIALAIRDIWPNAFVETSSIYLDRESYSKFPQIGEIILPKQAGDFITEFDLSSPEEREELKEISFEVLVPEEVISNINIDELKPLLENHPTLAILS